MDRLAAHVIATAALTVTLATVPVLCADVSHAAAVPAAAVSALAPTVPVQPCSDRVQVGQAAHEIYQGIVAFSIEEFYSPSCHAMYGYSFASSQFRALHVRYDVGMAVYDETHGAIDGAATAIGGVGGPAYWSAAVHVVPGTCYEGEGHYFYYPPSAPGGFIEGDTRTDEVCA
jgi:hypothetical protein